MKIISCCKKIIQPFLSMRKKLKWIIDGRNERKKINKKERLDELFSVSRPLIIIPHPDDEWIGCSSIIKKKNIHLAYMNMQGDDTEETHKTRYKELLSLSKKYDCKLYFNGNEGNEFFIVNLIRNIKPDYVFVPCPIDWHLEHMRVLDLFDKAISLLSIDEKIFKIALYQITVPFLPFLINNYTKMSKKDWKAKWVTFGKIYLTQKKFPIKRIGMNERINGGLTGDYAIESFFIFESATWVGQYKKILISNDEMQIIRNNLNNIKKLRNVLVSIYNKKGLIYAE